MPSRRSVDTSFPRSTITGKLSSRGNWDGRKSSGPWERTNRLPVVSELMERGGVQDALVAEEENELPLPSPEIWWDIVMGTGMRKWVTDLGEDGARRVREQNLDWVRKHRIQSLKLSAIYAVARKG